MTKWDTLFESDVSLRRAYTYFMTHYDEASAWAKLIREAQRNNYRVGWPVTRFRLVSGPGRYVEAVDVVLHTREDYPDLDKAHKDGIWAVHTLRGTHASWIVLPVLADYIRRKIITPTVTDQQGNEVV